MNTVLYLIILHTIDKIKSTIYKNFEHWHDISKSTIYLINETLKFSFSMSIVEYNIHIKKSNENAQQKLCYSFHDFANWYE